jgi:MFS family permease
MIDRTEAAVAAAAPPQVGSFSLLDQIYVSLLWFALFANWLTVVPVILPDQVSTILGPDAAIKEGVSGTILALGALIALVLAPVAGSLSDRLRSASGRRRPFLIAGMAGTCAGLALLIPFGAGTSILLYAIAFLNLQFCWNWVCGPYAGLIPDVVPERDQASASAWMNIMSVLGTMAGKRDRLCAVRPRPSRPGDHCTDHPQSRLSAADPEGSARTARSRRRSAL